MNNSQYVPPNVRKSLKNVVKLLNRFKVRYLVIGAIPVQYYGRPRTSWDVDLVIMTPIGKEQLFKMLSPERYNPVSGTTDVFKFKDLGTKTFLDIILKPQHLGLTYDSFKNKKAVTINGTNVNIVSPEDYIITKLKSRRAGTGDFHDIVTTLTNMYDKLEWSYLERRAKTLNLHHLLKYYREGIEWKRRGQK